MTNGDLVFGIATALLFGAAVGLAVYENYWLRRSGLANMGPRKRGRSRRSLGFDALGGSMRMLSADSGDGEDYEGQGVYQGAVLLSQQPGSDSEMPGPGGRMAALEQEPKGPGAGRNRRGLLSGQPAGMGSPESLGRRLTYIPDEGAEYDRGLDAAGVGDGASDADGIGADGDGDGIDYGDHELSDGSSSIEDMAGEAHDHGDEAWW